LAAVVTAGLVVGASVVVLATAAEAGPSADHLFVSQVSTTSSATAVSLARVTGTGGSDGSPIALPTTASGSNRPFTLEGDSSAVGALARSADGRYVTLAGYTASPGAAFASVPRVVARVDGNGVTDTSTTLGTSFQQEKIRGAVSDDGSRFWVTGHGNTAAPKGGLVYARQGTSQPTVVVSNTDDNAALNNTRVAQIADGNLYFSSEKGDAGVYRVGTLPTATAPASFVAPVGSDGQGPVGFVLLDRDASVPGADTMYVLRETKGIYKFSSNGSTWTSRGLVSGTSSYTALTGLVDGGAARLYAVKGDGAKNQVVQLTDTAAATSAPAVSSPSTVVTAPSGTAFRGVALAPGSAGTPPTSTTTSSPTTPPSSTTPTTTSTPSGPVGTPTLSLSTAYLSGSVRGIGDETVTATVAQSGADPSAVTITATASSRTSVARAVDVTATGTGGSRQISVAAQGVGYTDLTLKATGLSGKSTTTVLHYAASAAVQDAAVTHYVSGAGDASAAVDAGDGYMIVADDETNQLRLYRRDVSGAPVRSWDFTSQAGVSIEMDLEAATRTGDTIYWTGSMGNSKSGELRPDRAILFSTKVSGSGAGTQLTFGGGYKGLRADLISWDNANGKRFGLAEGASEGNIPKQIDGFNAEGLEFAPGSSTTAYLGFRAPLVPPSTGGKALVVPVTNMDRIVTGSHATFGTPILMDLGGLSVRDIRKNAADQYLILAGSWAADDNSDPYALYSWDGVPAHAPVLVRSLPTADAGAWESIVDVPDLSAPGAQVQLVTDAGAADLYNDGTETKELPHNEWKKSRVTWFTLG
jgi:hypothetical protein